MKQKSILFICFFLFIFSFTQAQRIKLLDGNPEPIFSQKKINAVFSYNNMRVGKFEKEEDYVSAKKQEYNKKEAGKGDQWEKNWIGDRKSRYEPNFIELFEKNSDLALGNYPDAQYTMLINTTRIEPGYNVYISRKNAEIDLEIKIIETATQKEIASYSIKSAPGRTFGGYDYDTGVRIEEAYATAGKHFAKNIK